MICDSLVFYCKKWYHEASSFDLHSFEKAMFSQALLLYWKSYSYCIVSWNDMHVFSSYQYYQFNEASVVVPFFGLVSLLSLPSLASLSSRSLQRRTCSSLIFKKRILFCSSLRASSTSGSTHMSSRILASILSVFPVYRRRPSAPLSLRPVGLVSVVFFPAPESGSLSSEECGIRCSLNAGGHCSVLCQVLFLDAVGLYRALWGWRHYVRINWALRVAVLVFTEKKRERDWLYLLYCFSPLHSILFRLAEHNRPKANKPQCQI